MAKGNRDSSSIQEHWAGLLRAWQEDGNLEALDELLQVEIHELKQRILARGKGILRSAGSASDIVNDAVVRILNAKELPRFENRRVFSAYLWTCAWRLLLQRLRKRKHEMMLLNDRDSVVLAEALAVSGGQSTVDRNETARQVTIVMALLSPKLRTILDMHFFRDMPLEQIAADLGVSRDAARMRLIRAKRRLAEKLETWRSLVS